MTDIRIPGGIITVAGCYKPGDMPPDGYLEWHEWAEVQRKAGIKQVACGRCGKWKTPQELSDQVHSFIGKTSRGRSVEIKSPICLICVQIGGEHGL